MQKKKNCYYKENTMAHSLERQGNFVTLWQCHEAYRKQLHSPASWGSRLQRKEGPRVAINAAKKKATAPTKKPWDMLPKCWTHSQKCIFRKLEISENEFPLPKNRQELAPASKFSLKTSLLLPSLDNWTWYPENEQALGSLWSLVVIKRFYSPLDVRKYLETICCCCDPLRMVLTLHGRCQGC